MGPKCNGVNQMHPRNLYKSSPPNFAELSEKYPEFRKHCTVDETGKVSVNFQSGEAVRVLSVVLMKENHGLEMEVPPLSLVPRIPQRLNYLLWLQDILHSNSHLLHNPSRPRGVDIGTGASCVYPLLGAKKFGWGFIGTEKDPEGVACALRNVQRNGLQDQIEIVQVSEGTALIGALDSFSKDPSSDTSEEGSKELKLDFTMCNPPFYSSNELPSDQEDDVIRCSQLGEDRKGRKRGKPHSESLAKINEVSVPGGELEFVSKIIRDSAALGTKIQVYTSMIGKKGNVGKLKSLLEKEGASQVSQTVFCQGKTMRWALAWSFNPLISLEVENGCSEVEKGDGKKKTGPCFRIPLPEDLQDEFSAKEKLLQLIQGLQMEQRQCEPGSDEWMVCEARRNTWSNQRRKRREKLQREAQSGEPSPKNQRVQTQAQSSADPNRKEESQSNGQTESNPSVPGTQTKDTSSSSSQKTSEEAVYVKFSVKLESNEEGKLVGALEWMDGFKKDHLHQIVQFMKNSLKR